MGKAINYSCRISYEEMENFMKERGYRIVALSEVAKFFNYTKVKLVKELRLTRSTLNYKIVFKPEEERDIYNAFIKIINRRRENINKYGEKSLPEAGGKYFWLSSEKELYGVKNVNLYNYILENKFTKVFTINLSKLLRQD